MKHEIFAPVLIPTLCRYKHFKRCVESLSICTYAENTALIIALDYPLTDEHWEGYLLIKEYIKEIKGFKTVRVFERSENYGVVRNIFDSVDWISKRHESFILSEDDNEFSPNFLDYMNNCLNKFANNDEILTITAYNRMIDMSGYNKNIYVATSYCGWGEGQWTKKYQFLQKEVFSVAYAESISKSWKKSYKIYKRYPQIIRGLLSIVKTGKITGDTLAVSYMILNKKYSIWPTVSKVRNHGFDGGGEHQGSIPGHHLLSQKIDTNSMFVPDDIENMENEMITLRTRQYSKMTFPKRVFFGIYIPVRYFIYRFTGIIILK